MNNIESLLADLDLDNGNYFNLDNNSPYSPIQCKLNAMTQCNTFKSVRISSESVNYVLLDDEPEIRCSKLLIAQECALDSSKNSNTLALRNTCLFPKIKGLVSLCLMIFSPSVELRVDRVDKKYTGALCGLGYDKDKQRPIHLENDIEDTFEVEFDSKDLKQVLN